MITTASSNRVKGDGNPYPVLERLEIEILDNYLLRTEIGELETTNVELKANNVELKTENDRLKSELAKYQSPNIPSSKQLFPKRKFKSSGLPRTHKKRKRGGSKKGKTSPTWDQKEPDVVANKYVDKCLNCGKSANIEDQTFHHSKRVLELPKVVEIQLEEHHIHQYECDCGHKTQAGNPTLEGTSLGPNLLTLLTSIRFRTGTSFENISQLLNDHTNKKLSQTAFYRGLAKVSECLEPVSIGIASEVMNSKYVQFDETSHKLVLEGKESSKGSKKIWVWVAAIPNAVYYHVDLSRSTKALDTMLEFRYPDKPPLIGVSDAFSVYINSIKVKQFCWAHHLRDSKDLEDKCENGRILHLGLSEIFKRLRLIQEKLRVKGEPASVKLYDKILKELYSIANGPTCENVVKIQKHILRRAEHYITFLKHPEIPMTNNHAEQLLKSVIVHRSNGKPLRSIKAMKDYGIILTVLTTWKLQGKSIASTLREWIGKNIDQSKLIK